MTFFQEIKLELENGATFYNDSNTSFTWAVINRDGVMGIQFYEGEKDSIKYYKNIDSFTKRVKQLLNRGY